MQSEILAGVKNAMEHGSSMESAIQSFINAGYNPQEVMEAAKYISTGVSNLIYVPEENSIPENKNSAPTLPKKEEAKIAAERAIEKNGGGKSRKALLLTIIIIALLVFLGAIGYLVYNLLKVQ